MTQSHSDSKTPEEVFPFSYRTVLGGIAAGILGGAVIILFRLALELAGKLLQATARYGGGNSWFIPVWFGVLTAACYLVYRLVRWEPLIAGGGVGPVVKELDGKGESCWWRVLLAKLLGSVLCMGCGLSLGREGPSVQLGAMAGKGISRLHKAFGEQKRLWMLCGASAGLAAAFGAPMSGILFCLEKFRRDFTPGRLLPVMAASVTADALSSVVFGIKPVFAISASRALPLSQYGHLLWIGILLGGLGIAYQQSLRLSKSLYQKQKSLFLRLLVPFWCAGIFAFTLPDVLGDGHIAAMKIADGQFLLGALCLLFLAKFVFSMVSIGSDAPGGVFLPVLVMGCMIGGIYCSGMEAVSLLPEGLFCNFLLLGMAGYFSAVIKTPITGVLLVSEMTGFSEHLLPLSVVSLIAYLVAGLLPERKEDAPVRQRAVKGRTVR